MARLLRANTIDAKQTYRFQATTESRHILPVVPNGLNPCFEASRPNRVWVADTTYLPTGEG